ncbi:MAG: dockerin type I domain-containing protein [Phycisphaerae bacterium]
MFKRFAYAAIMGIGSAALAQTVTVSLTSPQNSAIVAPGSTVNWTISFTDSTGNNQGAALVCGDLTQDTTNPVKFDIPVAAGVPAGMTNFARPAGISNPGTGYRGTQVGTAGQRNLIQIGGGQNTFGVAQPPGTGIAENATVVPGVGQSGSQMLATGSFTAPSACGTYTYRLANVTANVITLLASPPNFSVVNEATVAFSGQSFAFSIGIAGDANGDNVVNESDLGIILSNWQLSVTPHTNGDVNGDGVVNESDLGILLSNWQLSCP